MRALLCVVTIAAARLAYGSESFRVDGVVVYGRLRAVSVADIHETIIEYTHSLRSARKPRALEVVSKNEIRAYHPEGELGWKPMRRVDLPKRVAKLFPRDEQKNGWYDGSRPIEDIAEALRLIRTADQVYVFPVTLTEKSTRENLTLVIPRRDQSAPRLLGGEARRKLTGLLSYRKNWFHGFDNTISLDHVTKNVGFVFRRGTDELVLFCTFGATVEATFNGQSTGGFLQTAQQMEEWKKRYAQPELIMK